MSLYYYIHTSRIFGQINPLTWESNQVLSDLESTTLPPDQSANSKRRGVDSLICRHFEVSIITCMSTIFDIYCCFNCIFVVPSHRIFFLRFYEFPIAFSFLCFYSIDTSQTELPEIPLNLKSGHVENRSQNDVELEPETDPKSPEMNVRSPPVSPADETMLAKGAEREAMEEGEATATKFVPEKIFKFFTSDRHTLPYLYSLAGYIPVGA